MSKNWVNELQRRDFKGIKSQFAEDAIILFIFDNIPPANKFFVDIGAGFYGHGQMSNTQALIDEGWKGIQVDSDNSDNPNIECLYVTPGNIIPEMNRWGVEKGFDFLNIDIDSFDLDILEKIVPEYWPRVICTEFNGTLDPATSIKLKYEPGYIWDETNKYGYSFGAAVKFCDRYGYDIILNHENQNLFLVRKGLCTPPSVINVQQVFYHPVNPAAEWDEY